MTIEELVVTATIPITPRVRAFELRHVDGRDLPAFDGGSHIEIEVRLADGERVWRCYSLLNDPARRDRYEIAVLREDHGRGGSAYMHEAIKAGDRVVIRSPKCQFPLALDVRRHRLIAGGIGITPFLSMIHVLLRQGADFELHYVARSPELMAYRDEIEALVGGRAHLYFDDGDPRRGLDVKALVAGPVSESAIYVCGPRPLIGAVLEAAREAGWPESTVRFESFAPPAAEDVDVEIDVVLNRSGRTLKVAKDETILDALIAAGEKPIYDCKRGECGVCIVGVLAGEPLHRDLVLSPAEKADGHAICVCVSRAKTRRLVLDL